jgi:lipoprotein-anchoring transpeptidase ErfK/SrfK
MKYLLPVILIPLLLAVVDLSPSAASEAGQTPQSGAVLCLPGIYPTDPVDCLPTGPSQYLTQMAAMGLTFPQQPLPARRSNPELRYVPFNYAMLDPDGSARVFNTLEEAIADGTPAHLIEPGRLKFISYINTADTGGSEKPDFFQLRNGGWTGDIQTRWSSGSSFQGLVFSRTPATSFGWITPINDTVETRRTPGYQNEDYTGRQYGKYEVVQVYAEQKVGDIDWYLIGPDEWLAQTTIARVTPNTTPPEGVTGDRWIEVNLFEQTLAVYDRRQLVFATIIASGLDPFFTRPGVFQIYKKLDSTTMSGAFEADRSDFYYLEDVPWTMYYDDARALHGAYWRTAFGFPQSHGCVNLSIGDAHWLFDWAQEGDWVYVWDPSGQTPTDPKAYEMGGAP